MHSSEAHAHRYTYEVQIYCAQQKWKAKLMPKTSKRKHYDLRKAEAKVSRSTEVKQWRHTSLELPDKITIPDARVTRCWCKATLVIVIKKVNCPWRLSRIEAGSQARTQVIQGLGKPLTCSGTLPKTAHKTPIVSGLCNCSVIFNYCCPRLTPNCA